MEVDRVELGVGFTTRVRVEVSVRVSVRVNVRVRTSDRVSVHHKLPVLGGKGCELDRIPPALDKVAFQLGLGSGSALGVLL